MENKSNASLNIIKVAGVLIVIGLILWYFSDIVGYVIAATFIGYLGTPLVKHLDQIKIRNFKLPHVLNVVLTLLLMITIFAGFIVLVVPLILKQADIITSINIDAVFSHFQEPLNRARHFLIQYNIANSNATLSSLLYDHLRQIVDLAKFTNIFSAMIGTTSSFLMGAFIILFLTFYTMLEPSLFKNFILNLTPSKYEHELSNVLSDSRRLLTRYSYGVFAEVAIMMTLEVIGLTIFGIPNALLIGFLGGLMNVIPYLGPLIGASAGIILAILSQLGMGSYDSIVSTIFIVLAVFGVANMIDNFVLQPQIYSKSVKAHPVEVFLVIIIGGKLAGITGMILAIPSYTIVKVVARQFMNHMRVVKFLTQRM